MLLTREENRCCFDVQSCCSDKRRQDKRTEENRTRREGRSAVFFCFFVQKTEQEEVFFCSVVLLFCCFAVQTRQDKRSCVFHFSLSCSLVVLLPSYFSCLVKQQIELNVLIWFTFAHSFSTTFCLTTNHFLFKKLTTKQDKNPFCFKEEKGCLFQEPLFFCRRIQRKETQTFVSKKSQKFLFHKHQTRITTRKEDNFLFQEKEETQKKEEKRRKEEKDN